MRFTKTVAGVVLATALPLAGCGQGGPGEQPSPAPSVTVTPRPAPFGATVKQLLEADRAHPDKVATAFATLITSWDMTADRTETAAAVRARPLMTPKLAARTVEPQRNASQALWLELGPLGAFSAPTIGPGVPIDGDEGTDTEDTAYRNFTATWTWHDANGKHLKADERKRNIFLVLTRNKGTWSVADYVTEDLPG
jgi:predicted small lipoprotein YifL